MWENLRTQKNALRPHDTSKQYDQNKASNFNFGDIITSSSFDGEF